MGDGWTHASWNTCAKPWCRSPVEGPGGSVEFFDGGEAYCIDCDQEYVVCIVDCAPFLVDCDSEMRRGLAKLRRQWSHRKKRPNPNRGRR